MDIFIAISKNIEKLEAMVQKEFPNFNQEIIPGVWAVASEKKDLTDVVDALGINTEGETPGIVFTLNAYHGYYDPTLWDKFNRWGEA